MNATPNQASGALRAIALYKLVEATLLIIVGIGTLRLLHGGPGAVATDWIRDLHLDPNRAFIHALLARATGLDPRTLQKLSAGTFAYAALRIVEGVGLWLRKRWAEYLTIIATAALLPVELFEIARHVSLTRIAVLIVNAAVVVYLVQHMRREQPKIPHENALQ